MLLQIVSSWHNTIVCCVRAKANAEGLEKMLGTTQQCTANRIGSYLFSMENGVRVFFFAPRYGIIVGELVGVFHFIISSNQKLKVVESC